VKHGITVTTAQATCVVIDWNLYHAKTQQTWILENQTIQAATSLISNSSLEWMFKSSSLTAF